MLFEQMASAVKKNGLGLAKEVVAILKFVVADQNIKFLVDVKSGSREAGFGENAKTACTITMAEADFLAMANGMQHSWLAG